MTLQLFRHQEEAVRIMAVHNNFMLADEPGLGKTATLVNLAARTWDGHSTVFVCCPRNVIQHWRNSFQTWAPNMLPAVMVTNYEQLKNVPAALNPGHVIIDESHKLKNETSDRFQMMYNLWYGWHFNRASLGRSLRVNLASGTPVYSYPIDLMTALLLLSQLALDRVPAFKARYCDPTRRHVGGGRKILDLRGSSNLDELRQLCQPFLLRRSWKDAGIEMPAVTLTDLYVKERITDPDYAAASLDFKAWYKASGGKGDAAGLARFTVLRRVLALAKVDAAVEQAADDLKGGQRVIVFTEFRDSATRIHERLRALGYEAALVMGGQTITARDFQLSHFKSANPCALVATTDSLGEGTDGLQDNCRLAIFVDLDFEPAMFVQALRRIWRIGQRHPVAIRRLFIEGDKMEEFIQANLLKKESVQRQLGLEDASSLTTLRGKP
jgi:SNF2 family DNA or RNA helicase